VNRVQIPGFRKGKAPRSIVESFLGRNAMLQEGIDSIVTSSLNQALERESLEPFGEPEIESLELDPVSFKAIVPLEPQVELGDFRDMRLDIDAVEITDEQVTEVLDQLQRSNGVWEPREGAVRFDDMVNLNVEGTIEGNRVLQDQGVDFIPRQDSPVPFPGFSVYLEGMNSGEDKQFTLTVPEDYRDPSIAGKECRFEIKVLEVKELRLPDLDDEFAKGVGDGFDDMEALRAHILERITGEAESQANYSFQEQSMTSLLESATITASDLLLEREVQNMQDERERMLRNQRLDLDTYLSYVGKSEEEFQDELRPLAEDRLNRMLVVRKLAQEEELDVTPDEIQEEIETMLAGATEENENAMRRALNSEGTRESIRGSLLNQKVMARLVEIVQGLEAGALAEQTEEESDSETEAAADSETVEEAPESPTNEADASDNEGA
jgi:trigger factor